MAESLVFTLLGIDRLSEKFNQSGDAADRMADRIDRVGTVSAASLLGLPAAGGLAGAGVVAGLAAIPIALGVVAAVSQSTNAEVAEGWSAAGSEIAAGMSEVTGPLADDLVSMSGRVAGGFRQIAPEIQAMSEAAGPGLLMLTDGVVGLAVEAVPGMRRAVEQSTPAMAGLSAAMISAGRGASTLFDELSRGAPAAGRNMASLGLITEDLLGTGGRLVTMLSDNFSGTFAQVTHLLDQTTDAAVGLGEGGLPVIAGSASTLLGVADSLLGALGPLAPQLGSIAAVALSMSAGSKIFGFLGDQVTRLGERVHTTGTRFGEAGKPVRGLGTALSAIGPYGAAAGAALLGLSAIMERTHGTTDQLATSLMAGGQAAEKARQQLADNADAVKHYSEGTSVLQDLMTAFAPKAADVNAAIADQRTSMTLLQRAQADATKAANDHSFAVERFGASSPQAAASSTVLTHAQQRLRDIQADTARATQTLTDRLTEQQTLSLGLANSNLALRMSTDSYSAAQRDLNEAIQTKGQHSAEAATASLQLEQAALRVIQASGQEALSHYANQQSVEAQTASVTASNLKLLELAASMEGPVPVALQQMIANMDDATLSAFGATRSIDETNQAVIRLSPGKEIVINAKDNANWVINSVRNNAQNLDGSWFDIFVNTNYTSSGSPPVVGNLSGLGLIPERAEGGPVEYGRTYLVGERGPELLTLDAAGGYVHDNAASMRMLAESSRRSLTPVGAGVGAGAVAGQTNYWAVSFPAARDAGEIRRALLELKRDLGGVELGIG